MKQWHVKRLLSIGFLLTLAANTFAVISPRQDDLKLSDAYKVLALRRAELKSELRFLKLTLTGHHPDLLQKEDQFNSVTAEMTRLERSGKPFQKLNASYGQLLLNKAAIAAELKTLRRSLKSSHPLVIAKETEWLVLDSEAERISK